MTEYAPKPTYYASETQRIANELPSWMKIRRERDSNGQYFLGAPGRILQDINDDLDRMLRDRFLTIANADEPDQMRMVELPVVEDLKFPATIENFLFNASFELNTSHDRLPDWWQSEGNGSVTVSAGLLGANGIQLQAGTDQFAAIYQEVDEPIRAGVPWCFYVWHKSAATGLTAPATGFGLEVTGTRGDASTETLRASFTPDTGGYQRLAAILGSFSQDVVKWKFRAIVTNAAGFRITTPVTVDIAMASPGQLIKPWRPNPFDTHPYLNYFDGLAPVIVEHPVRAQYVERIPDFWDKALPTRAGTPQLLSSGGTIDPVPTAGADGFAIYGQAGAHTEVDVWEDEWPVEFQLGLDGANPRVRGIGTVAADIFGPFELAFRNWRNWFEDGISWTPEAMTWLHDRLHVVLQKQDYQGTTKRYLAFVDQRFSRPFSTYMEVVAMIELAGISTGTRITRAEYRYSDQQHLYIGNGESEWVYPLYYDLFMVDFARKRLYLREEYDLVVPQLMVPQKKLQVELRRG
jgi:hypothetical protein